MVGLVFRLLLKAMVPLMIVFGAMFYVMYLNGQNPLAVFDGFGQRVAGIFSNVGESASNLPGKVSGAVEGDSRTFYKWQDATGSWHYGEDPPANAQSLTAITLRLTDNVVPAFQDPNAVVENEEEFAESDSAELDNASKNNKKKGKKKGGDLENPYSPEQIQKLFENANQLQETMSQRTDQLNQLIGSSSSEE